MEKIYDTSVDTGFSTPRWFTVSPRILAGGILSQFLSGGLALFHDRDLWGLHAALGGTLPLSVIALLAGRLSFPG
ncbi:hypothetical protein GCM10007242_04660 [Pigmentiphaga litoralis]|uniref:hypothetical protein n=1 Tax=Pigmentiphaga litoralis TaxID=516702 RepID=UPI0019BF82F5|nr:hypothetical protein [Pigmentiphaga litoralis]GGX02654.1 hypothetical protein GCM10007242_04660 [Pigmentiphaga litoralis]